MIGRWGEQKESGDMEIQQSGDKTAVFLALPITGSSAEQQKIGL